MNLFSFPDNARWNETVGAVEFGIAIGEYHGVVRVPRRVFQVLLRSSPTPQSCVEAYHFGRAQFERAAEVKLRARDLCADGNIELTTRDLKELG